MSFDRLKQTFNDYLADQQSGAAKNKTKQPKTGNGSFPFNSSQSQSARAERLQALKKRQQGQ